MSDSVDLLENIAYNSSTPLRSFARRIGKSLSKLQRNLLAHNLPHLKFDHANFTEYLHKFDEICLEIGFGMGEHLHNLALCQPTKFFIGSEPYLNGVANLIKYAVASKLHNLALWPDDIDLVLNFLPDNSLNSIYILFPDPWPKNSQVKRRFINSERLEILKNKLKISGKLYFASDIVSYINYVDKLVLQTNGLRKIDKDIQQPHENYITTKYHAKALNEDRLPMFVEYNREISLN